MIWRKPPINLIADRLNTQGGISAIYKWDSTIFDNFNVPSGMDKGLCMDTIFFKYGTAPIFHPDPAYLKYYIGAWSRRMLPVWEKLYATTNLDYNPIHNYDRTEERTLDTKGTEDTKRGYGETIGRGGTDDLNVSRETSSDSTDNSTRENTQTATGNVTDSGTSDTTNNSTVDGNQIHQVSAENADTFQNDTKDDTLSTTDGTSKTTTSTDSSTTANTETTEKFGDIKTDKGTETGSDKRIWKDDTTRAGSDDTTKGYGETVTESMRAYGNIGVTTTQDMIAAERNIVQFTVEDAIADSFFQEFCLDIW